jgi:hypothetical protein
MTLETLISAFLNYSKVEKGLSANTIAAMNAISRSIPLLWKSAS